MSQLIEKQGKYYMEANVVMVSENTASKIERNQLWTHNNGSNSLRVWNNPTEPVRAYELNGYCVPQNLYLISDEYVKEGDWYLKNDGKPVKELFSIQRKGKIIASTNIKLGVVKYTESGNVINAGRPVCFIPQPSKEFIESFIEQYNLGNPIINVLVEYELIKEDLNHGIQPKTKNDTIVIKKKENANYTEAEVIALCRKAYSRGHFNASFSEGEPILDDKWINENLK